MMIKATKELLVIVEWMPIWMTGRRDDSNMFREVNLPLVAEEIDPLVTRTLSAASADRTGLDRRQYEEQTNL